jgi:hypothetical protein
MSTDFLTALSRSSATEQIAEILYETGRGESVLTWDDLPCRSKEDFRAHARHSIRLTLDYAVTLAIEQMAISYAGGDGYRWSDVSPSAVARYRHRARAAFKALQFHLAETAYPEETERELAEAALQPRGQTLGDRVAETRARVIETHAGDWRNEFAKERL